MKDEYKSYIRKWSRLIQNIGDKIVARCKNEKVADEFIQEAKLKHSNAFIIP